MCKSQPLVKEILDFISCDGGDDNYDPQAEVRMDRHQQMYSPVKPTYSGLAGSNHGSPVRAPAPGAAQRQSLPGESVVVTYDVMGEMARLANPGESMVVTNSQFAPRVPSLGAGPSLLAASPGGALQPTKSFDIAAPYKVGDRVEIWSESNKAWCMGSVEKAQADWVQISYRSPNGQQINKVMPNDGHEHIRFHGHPWQGSMAVPMPNTAAHMAPPSPTSSPTHQAPIAGHTYHVGDEIELYSASQNTWVRGSVHKADGDWITINYKGPGGQPMTKIMPNGHEQLRVAEGAGAMISYPHLAEPQGLLSTGSSPPPPPTRPYRVGDHIEIWSTSQNTWCRGEISKLEGDMVNVAYRGPGGQPMNKIMPNGHAHLRLLPH